MKVLFAAVESSPFIKVGGLGDVVGGLPKQLVKNGVDARVILPLFSVIDKDVLKSLEYYTNFVVKYNGDDVFCSIFKTELDSVTYYFINNDQYFGRDYVYGENDEKTFAFFSKAVLDSIYKLDFLPDVIHIHDWHTSMVPVYLKYSDYKDYSNIKTVLTVHNFEFQGKTNLEFLKTDLSDLPIGTIPVLTYDGQVNLLKAGIETSDIVTTVSPSYADEVLKGQGSYGLHKILNSKQCKLTGILNGIDTDVFNPETDKNIKFNYAIKSISKMSNNKKFLQESLGLFVDKNTPVFGMVSRITDQKGFELFSDICDEIKNLPLQLVVLGTGHKNIEDMLKTLEEKLPDKIRFINEFSTEIASQIYAGADFLIMPSKAEPCGLSQMIAMRYGTIPVVHKVGGLADSVISCIDDENGNGLLFKNFEQKDMLDKIKLAIDLYKDKKKMTQVVENAMKTDFSWQKPANEYIKIYKKLLNKANV